MMQQHLGLCQDVSSEIGEKGFKPPGRYVVKKEHTILITKDMACSVELGFGSRCGSQLARLANLQKQMNGAQLVIDIFPSARTIITRLAQTKGDDALNF